jgi:hypothetical protein
MTNVARAFLPAKTLLTQALAFCGQPVHNISRIPSHLQWRLFDAQNGVFPLPLSILLFVKNC